MRILIYFGLLLSTVWAQDIQPVVPDSLTLEYDSLVSDSGMVSSSDTTSTGNLLSGDSKESDAQMSDPELLKKSGFDKMLHWAKMPENRIFLGSVGMEAIVTVVVLLANEDEPLPDDIGNPPNWPEN